MKKILFVLAVLFIVGCQPVTQRPEVEEGFVPDKTIEVDAFSFGYTPTIIQLEEGEKIRLIITNNENLRHTFTSTELGIDISLKAKSTETVDFVVPITVVESMTGNIDFFCTVFGHRPAGMQGLFNIN